MYTELVIKFSFKKEKLSELQYNVLDYMFNPDSKYDWENKPETPDDLFFNCHRWDSIGNSCSYYHYPNIVKDWYCSSWDKDIIYVFNRSDLKNYNHEIQLFLDWLRTLDLYTSNGEFIGYWMYEEDEIPTLIYL